MSRQGFSALKGGTGLSINFLTSSMAAYSSASSQISKLKVVNSTSLGMKLFQFDFFGSDEFVSSESGVSEKQNTKNASSLNNEDTYLNMKDSLKA